MRRILTLAVVALALAGCTATPPQPTHSVTADATPTPSAAAKPALGDLVIGPDGLGPVKLGEPVPVQPAEIAVVKYDPQYCKTSIEQNGGTFTAGDPFSGAWITTYADPQAFTVLTDQGAQAGAVTAIEANAWQPGSTSKVGTAAGVHAGDTRAELEKAYPKFTSVTHFDQTDIYTIVGTHGQLVFEVSPSNATDVEPDRILSIRAVRSASESPYEAGPMYGTDGGGPCPL
ncbi:MAG: hypothetical protein JWN36_765 [Microbacteriaceae bacterium]|nr:hypothetical protein [Microbacteriaceae bacterium]